MKTNAEYQSTTENNAGTLAECIDALRRQIEALTARVDRLLANRTGEDAVLTPEELAKALDVSPMTIWRWSKLGMPRLTKGGAVVRYRYGEVLAWLRVNKPRRKPR